MNLKERWGNLNQHQKRNVFYWLSVVGIVNVIAASQAIVKYLQTGQCRNYIVLGSPMESCTLFEFVKNGWAWVTFTDAFILLPAAAFMIMATFIVDQVFAKKE